MVSVDVEQHWTWTWRIWEDHTLKQPQGKTHPGNIQILLSLSQNLKTNTSGNIPILLSLSRPAPLVDRQHHLTRNAVDAVQPRDEGQSVAWKDSGLLVGFVLTSCYLGQQLVVGNARTARDAQLHTQGRPDVCGDLWANRQAAVAAAWTGLDGGRFGFWRGVWKDEGNKSLRFIVIHLNSSDSDQEFERRKGINLQGLYISTVRTLTRIVYTFRFWWAWRDNGNKSLRFIYFKRCRAWKVNGNEYLRFIHFNSSDSERKMEITLWGLYVWTIQTLTRSLTEEWK